MNVIYKYPMNTGDHLFLDLPASRSLLGPVPVRHVAPDPDTGYPTLWIEHRMPVEGAPTQRRVFIALMTGRPFDYGDQNTYRIEFVGTAVGCFGGPLVAHIYERIER